jgi:large subunit ribosomal protein L24
MNKFKKGDEIIVISGASKGKNSKILSIKKDKVTAEGVNLKTIHKKPTSKEPGRIIKEERPIHISNISHQEEGKPVKVRFEIAEGEEKSFKRKNRVSKKSGKKIG